MERAQTSVRVFFLGGTISMTSGAGPDDDTGAGASPRLDGASLLSGLPAPEGTVVDAVDFLRVGSGHLTFPDLIELARQADAAVQDEGYDGVVVVQGTDTLEETSYLLDLLWRHPEPLVATGAMRNPTQLGADGPANLLAALTLAASQRGRDLGVLVVMNDEIHAARAVAKRHTSSPAGFVSPDSGPLGRMLEGRPVLSSRVERRAGLAIPTSPLPHVPLMVAVLDDDADSYRHIATNRSGLVVAGFGAGHVKADVASVLGEIADRVPVVLASRTGAGSVHTKTYAGLGSEQDLLARGLISAGHLDPFKARLLLTVLLALGADEETIRAAFAEHGAD